MTRNPKFAPKYIYISNKYMIQEKGEEKRRGVKGEGEVDDIVEKCKL